MNIPDDPSWIEKTYLSSQVAVDYFNAPTSKFTPIEFHFHHVSEHTKDGRHIDAEMHLGL